MQNKTISEYKKELFDLLQKDALKRGSFILSSGKSSTYYLDGRIITLTPQGAYLVASIILEMTRDLKISAIGGPTLGADPIVGALACLSHQRQISLKTFIVRKQAKEHGMQRQIEGPALVRGERVVLVDDVATTGNALVEAKEALDKAGAVIDRAIVIVDRNEGARETLEKQGIRLDPIFSIKDFGL
jgi:orotate phosphoribosyltransferase